MMVCRVLLVWVVLCSLVKVCCGLLKNIILKCDIMWLRWVVGKVWCCVLVIRKVVVMVLLCVFVCVVLIIGVEMLMFV